MIHLVLAQHPIVPGTVVSLHRTQTGAENEAVELVNIMLKDCGHAPDATRATWSDRLEMLQSEHGAQYCDIEISAHSLKP